MTVQLVGWALLHSLWQGALIAFGCLLVLTFDQSENDKGWADSQGMLMKEVMPRFAGM